jgi:hypothetical protein
VAFLLVLLLSTVESISMKQIKTLTAVGWLITIVVYFSKGGNLL